MRKLQINPSHIRPGKRDGDAKLRRVESRVETLEQQIVLLLDAITAPKRRETPKPKDGKLNGVKAT